MIDDFGDEYDECELSDAEFARFAIEDKAAEIETKYRYEFGENYTTKWHEYTIGQVALKLAVHKRKLTKQDREQRRKERSFVNRFPKTLRPIVRELIAGALVKREICERYAVAMPIVRMLAKAVDAWGRGRAVTVDVDEFGSLAIGVLPQAA